MAESHPQTRALALTTDAPLAALPRRRERAALTFTEEQLKILRDSFLSGATAEEAALLVEVARVRRLDPFKRQIHFVKRSTNYKDERNNWHKKDIWAFQTSIDGFRALAEETGLYDGQDEPEFEYYPNDTQRQVPRLARVRIYRRDVSRPFVGTARYEEFVQMTDKGPNSMWAKMPHNQLAKCAEAQAFRKAFPEDLGGVYTDDEQEIDDKGRPIIEASVAPIGKGAMAAPPPAAALPREAQITKWQAAIKEATSLEFFAGREELRSDFGGKVPKSIADLWIRRERELQAAQSANAPEIGQTVAESPLPEPPAPGQAASPAPDACEATARAQLTSAKNPEELEAAWTAANTLFSGNVPPALVQLYQEREEQLIASSERP